MPTRLKCPNCGEKYYTAKSYHLLKAKKCDKCGSELNPTSDSYKQTEKNRTKRPV
ncbi:MAG: hypothetical protein ACOCRO_02365 [Halanaerobiales bacterium]